MLEENSCRFHDVFATSVGGRTASVAVCTEESESSHAPIPNGRFGGSSHDMLFRSSRICRRCSSCLAMSCWCFQMAVICFFRRLFSVGSKCLHPRHKSGDKWATTWSLELTWKRIEIGRVRGAPARGKEHTLRVLCVPRIRPPLQYETHLSLYEL